MPQVAPAYVKVGLASACVTATRVRVPGRFDLYHSSERSCCTKTSFSIDSVDLLSVKDLAGLSLNPRPFGPHGNSE